MPVLAVPVDVDRVAAPPVLLLADVVQPLSDAAAVPGLPATCRSLSVSNLQAIINAHMVHSDRRLRPAEPICACSVALILHSCCGWLRLVLLLLLPLLHTENHNRRASQ